jgi:hypothetical protein
MARGVGGGRGRVLVAPLLVHEMNAEILGTMQCRSERSAFFLLGAGVLMMR